MISKNGSRQSASFLGILLLQVAVADYWCVGLPEEGDTDGRGYGGYTDDDNENVFEANGLWCTTNDSAWGLWECSSKKTATSPAMKPDVV